MDRRTALHLLVSGVAATSTACSRLGELVLLLLHLKGVALG